MLTNQALASWLEEHQLKPVLERKYPAIPCDIHLLPIYSNRVLTDFCSGTPDRCKIGIHYIHVDNIRTVQEQLGHHDVKTTEILRMC